MSNQTDDETGEVDVREAFAMAQELARDIAQITRSEPRLPFPAAPFNYEAALHEIFAKEDEITQLARAFNDADEKRKKAKLALDQAHEQLSAMIAVIRVREEERRGELETREAQEDRDAVAEALERRKMIMPSMTIASWSPEERAAVIEWALFAVPGEAPPPLPFVLASSHVAGEGGIGDPQSCTQCGAILVLSPLDQFPEGWFVGTGCPGKPKAPEPEPAPRRRKRDA